MTIGNGRGLAAVKERAEEIQAQRQTFGLRRFTPEFRWDGSKPPAENALNLRVLGDDLVIPTKMHRGVPTGYDNNGRPGIFFGVCRRADPINADFCYVCDVKAKEFQGDAKEKKRNGLVPTDVAVGLAVEMEPASPKPRDWKLKMIEFQIPEITEAETKGTATDDVKEYRAMLDALGKPGTKIMVPNIGMIVGTFTGQQAIWSIPLYKTTVSDRVFAVSKHGTQLATVWTWEHEGADDIDTAELLASLRATYPFELPEEWIFRSAAQERYDYFFKLKADTPADAVAAASSGAGAEDDAVVPVASSARDQLLARLGGVAKK